MTLMVAMRGFISGGLVEADKAFIEAGTDPGGVTWGQLPPLLFFFFFFLLFILVICNIALTDFFMLSPLSPSSQVASPNLIISF